MKLTHLSGQLTRMSDRYESTPESVLDWLQQQLDLRGIDPTVYTRYILSLLQDYDQDHNEEVTPSTPSLTRDMSGFCCQRVIKRQNSCLKENIRGVSSNKWKHRRYRTTYPDIGDDCWPDYQCCGNGTDHQRKLAVVQCLKSASEEEFGIESFVDELCAKLKNIKLLAENASDVSPEPNTDPNTGPNTELTNNNNGVNESPKEQAMKYYAAFPALTLNKCESEVTPVSKPDTGPSVEHILTTNSSERVKWNGQKIIEYVSLLNHINDENNGCNDGCAGGCADGCATFTTDCRIEVNNENNNSEDKSEDNRKVYSIDANEVLDSSQVIDSNQSNFYYCEDIESNVLDVPLDVTLVDNQSPVDGIQEENYKFERLVNKFNRNIASIWSTTDSGDKSDAVVPKSDNIWTFDSSFSSNQSSATPSPKSCAMDLSIDLWSTLSVEQLARKDGPALNSWTASLIKSLNAFSDDGFIDCNNDMFDEDMSWPFPHLTDDQLFGRQTKTTNVTLITNKISLENHQKNSPFVEFINSNEETLHSTPDKVRPPVSGSVCRNGRPSNRLWDDIINKDRQEDTPNDSQFDKLLSLASIVDKSDNQLSPVIDENLLTSSKTHFQPIRQDSFDRSDSDEDSVDETTDTEVNKLVICSDKCPNNGETKVDQNYDTLKERPISTSFGELATFMGPFNDLEWTQLKCTQYSPQIMSDKSTNTSNNELEVISNLKTKLESIVETTVENEPEYQDLYQMINEVLKNGISEEEKSEHNFHTDHGNLHDNSIGHGSVCSTGFDDCHQSKSTDFKSVAQLSTNTIELNYLDKHSELGCPQRVDDPDVSPSDYITDYKFNDSFFKNGVDFDGCDGSDVCDQLLSGHKFDWIYEQTFGEYDNNDNNPLLQNYNNGQTSSYSTHKKREAIDSRLDIEYERRHNQYVSPCGHGGGGQGVLQWNSGFLKPCAFFIEGNCKRSDCKYSHDISAITCKYWEEGFCFKAELCPFLHGYVNEQNSEEMIVRSVEPFDSKSYAIESESDFPSLSTKCGDGVDGQMSESFALEADPSEDCLEKHFFGFHTKSVSDTNVSVGSTVGSAKAKLPITVFMKKKLRKRKDRNLQ